MDNSFVKVLLDNYKSRIKYIGNQHPVISRIKHINNNASDDSQMLFVAEGIWAHQKLVSVNLKIQSFLICPELVTGSKALELAENCINKAKEVFAVSKKVFDKISDRDGPDGFISLVQLPCYHIDDLQLKDNTVILILDGLETPGNIGAILRTCDGAGVDAVFICNKKARVTNPKLLKSSMGALFTIPVFEFNGAGVCVEWLKTHNFDIYLADTRAEKRIKASITTEIPHWWWGVSDMGYPGNGIPVILSYYPSPCLACVIR